ncbi:surface carbohydrate biosynthesis protein [Rhodospirillaceae bacterium SYSU D60014]|uniref:surface carbohydrate biosynthesis protein n=1 Tax=Virgifigura deserti TaxID=2268457 RepID=UPI000E669F36
MTEPPTIILPVEIQVRELDAKLLLTCLAAEHDFRVVVGCSAAVNQRLHEMPRSLYIGKGLSEADARMFRDARRLGHAVAAWDEEALVYMSPAFYLRRKTSAAALATVQALFAWGEDNAQIWRAAPGYAGQPLFATGNPRADLMRPDLRAYYELEVADLRRRFGDFILVNSNFGQLNHYRPELTLHAADAPVKPVDVPAERLGTWGDPNMVAYRHALFRAFRELVPQLARRMPALRIVIRPHPSEGHALWREAAAGCSNVEVVGEGNILPWLMAANAVIHNGCTTGAEAFLLGRPAIAYEPITHPVYDIRLPNALSHSVSNVEDLISTLTRVMSEAVSRDDTKRQLADRFIASMEGQLASERVLEAIKNLLAQGDLFETRGLIDWSKGQIASRRRRLKKLIRAWKTGAPRSDYVRHRFPDLGVAEIEQRIARLRMVTGRFGSLRIRQRTHNVFEVTRG